MKTENAALMKLARESLKGTWGLAIGAFVVYAIILGVVSVVPLIGSLGSLIIRGPMSLGIVIFALSLSRNQDPKLEIIFKGFERFGTALAAYLLMGLFVLLWTLLLIIPGIIAAISYSMTFFIIADDTAIGSMDAIKKSKQMMYGNKWKLFCLGWRFFGWGLLCILTLGIGFLWLVPYIQISMAKFYDDIKDGQAAAQAISETVVAGA